MTAKNDDLESNAAGKFIKDLFGSAEVVTKEERAARTSEPKEPQMRALRRIFGDVVLDIFPEAFIQSVEKAYVHWTEHPDSYLVSEFDSQAERDDSLLVMRAYAELAGEKGYTIRTERDTEPTILKWRVQNRRGTKDRD